MDGIQLLVSLGGTGLAAVGLYFSLGSRIGRIEGSQKGDVKVAELQVKALQTGVETAMKGLERAIELQVTGINQALLNCQTREAKVQNDHEGRLRMLEKG